MEKLKNYLKKSPHKRILDVGTGVGNFIALLEDVLSDYEEIVGIDLSENAIKAATNQFQGYPKIRFEKMDALNMTFVDQTFDIVSLSNSLHHLSDPQRTFAEMERVCKEDGLILLNEMRSDELSASQMGHRLIHEYSAEIDRELGLVHLDTYSLLEMRDLVKQNSHFRLDAIWNLEMNEEGDPQSTEQIEAMSTLLDRLTSRIKNEERLPYFQEKSEKIKEYIKQFGVSSATQVIMVLKR